MKSDGPKRILIFGGWFGSRNAGDEAILVALSGLLSRAFPGSKLFAHSIDPDFTRDVCGITPVFAPQDVPFIDRARALYRAYRSMDLFVVSGGTPIFDYYYMSRMFHFGIPLLHGIPMVYLGVGLKPIRSWHGKLFYRFVLSRAKYISARDPEVIQHLRAMRVSGEVALTADSAIDLPFKTECASKVLADAGVKPDAPVVGICPIHLSDNYKDHYHEPVASDCRKRSYLALAHVADSLLDEGKQVVFIPMHRVPPDDDREPIRLITQAMRGSAIVIEPPEDPRVVTAILARLDMLVGMRLHSLVLASSQHVPIVSIGFDMKVGGFMRYLGLPRYHQEISEIESARLLETVRECWDARQQVQHHLSETMDRWRGLIRASVEEAASKVD